MLANIKRLRPHGKLTQLNSKWHYTINQNPSYFLTKSKYGDATFVSLLCHQNIPQKHVYTMW